jgi:hypothetical protein
MPRRDVTLTDKISLLKKLKANCQTPVIVNWRR